MLKGFNLIGDLQMYWRICEETHLRSEHRQHYQHLIEPLAKLYSYIIDYQARVICHLSMVQLSRAWQDVTGYNDWTSKIGEIERLDKERRSYIDPLQAEEIRKNRDSQLQEIQKSRIMVPGTCEWFLTDERFCKWRDSKLPSLLWVSAGPGRGKSVLSRSLIDQKLFSTTRIRVT
jgi:ankyrin repeat domain-containing protein 50